MNCLSLTVTATQRIEAAMYSETPVAQPSAIVWQNITAGSTLSAVLEEA